jgi:hypothetical protein
VLTFNTRQIHCKLEHHLSVFDRRLLSLLPRRPKCLTTIRQRFVYRELNVRCRQLCPGRKRAYCLLYKFTHGVLAAFSCEGIQHHDGTRQWRSRYSASDGGSHHCSRSRARDIFDSMMHHSNPPKLQAATVLYTYTHEMHMLQMFYDTLPDCPCRHYDPISIETHMLESAVQRSTIGHETDASDSDDLHTWTQRCRMPLIMHTSDQHSSLSDPPVSSP